MTKRGQLKNVTSHKIVRYSIHSHHSGTAILSLECGHEKRQKGGRKIPARAFCRQCAEAESVHLQSVKIEEVK